MSPSKVSPKIQPLAEDLWHIEGDDESAALIRLTSGKILMWGAPQYSEALHQQIAAIGQPAHLLIPSPAALGDVGTWCTQLKECKFWAAAGVRRAANKRQISCRFAYDLGASPDPNWSSEMDQLIVNMAHGVSDILLFHYASETLLASSCLTIKQGWRNKRLAVAASTRRQIANKADLPRLMQHLEQLAPQHLLLNHQGPSYHVTLDHHLVLAKR